MLQGNEKCDINRNINYRQRNGGLDNQVLILAVCHEI